MDRPALLEELSRTLVKAKVASLSAILSKSDFPISDLIDLTFYPQKEVAFRAAWILEHLALSDLDGFQPYVVEFLGRYPKQANQSCRRHFTKILASLTRTGHSKQLRISEHYMLDDVVESTFEWLINPKTPVAVKVYCMEALFNLRSHFPWIREELEAEIVFLLHDGKAALQSRGRAILKKLRMC